MKKILVPTDFSTHAQTALNAAFRFAKKYEAEVDILHVISSLGGQIMAPEPEEVNEILEKSYIESIQENTLEMIQSYIKKIAFPEAQYKIIIETGNIFKKIKSYVKDHQIDLIMMGTHGTRTLEEIWVGSNTEKVVRLASCPVLAIKENAPDFDSFDNILFPSTLRDGQIEALQRMGAFANIFGGKIHLLYVNSSFGFLDKEEILERQEKFVEKAGLSEVVLHQTNARTEDAGILNMAKYLKVDLIALQSSQRKGIAHFFLGSTAEDVVNQAQVPVLTFGISKEA